MNNNYRLLPQKKGIALVAHDNRKKDLVEWVEHNKIILGKHELYATKSTGTLIAENSGLNINRVFSGPFGGDQQIGALIVTHQVHFLFFLWDTLNAQPHDPDVKALLRVATLWNIPTACNRSTADFIITSPLFTQVYERKIQPALDKQINN